MPSIRLTTYLDLVQHTIDWLGANVSGEARRDAKRAVLAAYRDLATAHRWHYYCTLGRINTVAHQTTGTIEYDHTGGAYERMVTLTGGTWPTWAPYGVLVINSVAYQVVDRKSSTVLTLSTSSNPGADIAAGTTYTLYRDTFPLPCDCLAIDELVNLNHCLWLTYERPQNWLQRQRIIHGPATPRSYTITSDPNYMGVLAVRMFPPPDQAYQLDFVYQRRPRQLNVEEVIAGTATIASGSITVTGSGTSWTSNLVGSVIRFSSNSTQLPTGPVGLNTYALERVVVDVTSTTQLLVDEAAPSSLTAVKYAISDPADIEDGAMLTALLRGCERQVAISRRGEKLERAEKNYLDALILAKEADSRSMARRVAGSGQGWPYRLADFPYDPTT